MAYKDPLVEKQKRKERYQREKADPVIREQWKLSKRASLYKITTIEVTKLLSNGCQSCGSIDNLAIDHNHVTGKIRGCLCQPCNLALGHLKDDPSRVLGLLHYIQSKD